MVIMALDHTRDYFHAGGMTGDPTNMETTTPFLFFTRWITHYCAPLFVFLSGTSIYLQSIRKTKKELSWFLFTRGLWLVIAECTIVSFGWSFDLSFDFFISFRITTWPVSGISSPVMILRMLVLPVPFLATKAIFWSLLIPKEMFSKSVRSPKDFDMFSTER